MSESEHPILRRGSTGDDVKLLQEKLIEAGFDIGKDGKFGKDTQTAVREFEKRDHLRVDGVAGSDVWDAVNEVAERESKDHSHPVKAAINAVSEEARNLIASSSSDTASIGKYRETLVKNANHAMGDDNVKGQYTGGKDVYWCAGFDDTIRNKTARDCGLNCDLLPVHDNLAVRYGGIETHAKEQGVFHKIGDGYTMQPGDSLIMSRNDRYNSDAGHVGVIESVDYKNRTITYIAGNAPDGNGGSEVSKATISMSNSSILGVVDEGALYENARDKQIAATQRGESVSPQSNLPFAVIPGSAPAKSR